MHTLTRRLVVPTAAALLLAGCSATGEATSTTTSVATSTAAAGTSDQTSSSATSTTPAASPSTSMAMHHPMDGGPAPAGIKAASNAKYPVGSTVTIEADHMPGMKGAPGVVTGVYSTVTYAVTYTPTTGGPEVVDHKWVVQEELAGAGTTRIPDGGTVTIEADHMPGMKGARGTVVSSTTEPVYMVDYTAGGMTMKNHKWVVESELQTSR